MNLSESQLLDKLIHRDEAVFRYFYNVTREPLFKYLQKNLDKEDAEEVMHDTYLAFIEGLRSFRGQSTLKTFLYAIGKRKAIDKLRRSRVKKILFSYLPEAFVESIAKVFLKDDIDKRLLKHRIESIFAKLPHDYSLVLRLKYKEDYSVREIAAHINVSFKTAESMLFRARKAFIRAYNTHERQTILTIEEALQ
ncbi:MAG: RNA polymerase sigma factor YlaC [Microgenomates bacterium OLB23]|nr:MAG: RNA polymerase sigma factor YlaC [Microgenomates bacterium OLB23]